MADKNTSGGDAAGFEQTVDDATRRVSEFNDRLLTSVKQAGRGSLEAYQSAVNNVVDLEKRAAKASPVELFTTIGNAHADFVRSANDAYIGAARELFK